MGSGERGAGRSARPSPAPPRLPHPRAAERPVSRSRGCAATMGTAAGGKAYFQRGSLFWFTVITLSFGYYTVRAGPAERRPRAAGGRGGVGPASAGRGVAQAQSGSARPEPRGRGGQAQEEDARALVRVFRLLPRSRETSCSGFLGKGVGAGTAPHSKTQ